MAGQNGASFKPRHWVASEPVLLESKIYEAGFEAHPLKVANYLNSTMI